MKNTSLILFAAVILIGWTSLAAGVLAVFSGQSEFLSNPHHHRGVPQLQQEPAPKPEPMLSGSPCQDEGKPAVPCAV